VSDETERLYEQARELKPEDRRSFIQGECAEDPRLRDDLASLVEEAESAEAFFEFLTTTFFRSPFEVLECGKLAEAGDRATTGFEDLLSGTTIGRYRIHSRIGSGGMGTVYRAHDEILDRDVALKFLPSLAMDPGSEARLLREARAAAALEHPNVCSIHEIGRTEDGRSFLAMGFHEGETLKQRLGRGPLPPQEAVEIATQIARGLSAAHARGIVHRDVKPGNVVLGSDGTTRLLDFGLAQFADATLGHFGAAPGTLAYMSPEQIRGGPVDARTDLWSLGIVLYEMLSGTRPFRAGNHHELLRAIRDQEPEPMSAKIPFILVQIVYRLLHKEPVDRYASANELLVDLESVSSSTLLRSRHWFLSIRGASLVAGTTAIAAVIGATLWLAESGQEHATLSDASLLLRNQSTNVAAYEYYLRGKEPTLSRSDSGVRQQLEFFQQAVAVDSMYAAAHAELAVSYLRTGDFLRAKRAAERAIALDDSLGAAHWAVARIRSAELDYAAAETELRRAIALDPTDWRFHGWLSHVLIQTGRPVQALAVARRALEADPLSPYAHTRVAAALFANGRDGEALAQLEPLMAIRPPLQEVQDLAGRIYASQERWPEAIASFRPVAMTDHPPTMAHFAHALARAGKREEANRILTDLLSNPKVTERQGFLIAVVYTGLGDFDQAFAWLDKAMIDNSLDWVTLRQPQFEDLRADPRFERIKERRSVQNSS